MKQELTKYNNMCRCCVGATNVIWFTSLKHKMYLFWSVNGENEGCFCSSFFEVWNWIRDHFSNYNNYEDHNEMEVEGLVIRWYKVEVWIP